MPNDPRKYYLLEVVPWSKLANLNRPLIDVVIIQNQDESRKEAWFYDFKKVARRVAKQTEVAPRSAS